MFVIRMKAKDGFHYLETFKEYPKWGRNLSNAHKYRFTHVVNKLCAQIKAFMGSNHSYILEVIPIETVHHVIRRNDEYYSTAGWTTLDQATTYSLDEALAIVENLKALRKLEILSLGPRVINKKVN